MASRLGLESVLRGVDDGRLAGRIVSVKSAPEFGVRVCGRFGGWGWDGKDADGTVVEAYSELGAREMSDAAI